MLSAWKTYKDSGFKTPPGVAGKSLLAPGSEEPKSWWVTNNILSDEGFNLSAARYKPQVGEKPPEDDPEDLIEQTLKLEREIVDGLQALLKDVGSA